MTPRLSNPQHEQFARLIADGAAAARAYVDAGCPPHSLVPSYLPPTAAGPALAEVREIAVRIAELRASPRAPPV